MSSVTSSAAITNLTSGGAGGGDNLKGAEIFNNSIRYTGTNIGIRKIEQVKPNGQTGSLFEQRIAWDGVSRWRWGKLSSAANEWGISDEAGSRFRLTNSQVYFPSAYNDTTADAVNVNIGNDGRLRRSTSSMAFKTDIEDIDPLYSHRLIDEASPVYYRSTCVGDNPDWSYWGLIAEEVAKIDPRLVSWKTHEAEQHETVVEVSSAQYDPKTGELAKEAVYETVVETVYVPLDEPEPVGVYYDRFVPHLLVLTKELKGQNEHLLELIRGLSQQNAEMSDRLAALENANTTFTNV